MGTNMAVGFLMASTAWAGHVVQGHVDYPLAVLMGASAVAGTYTGARLTGRVRLDRLVLTMGIVLLAVGSLLASRGLGVG